jgi:hypothetical protein
MTKAKKEKYEGQERLRDILTKNLNGKKLKVICSECGY